MSRGTGQRGRKTPQARQGQGRSARARRTRAPITDTGLGSQSFVFRHRAGNAVIFLVLILAASQLFNLQVPRAAGLRAEAASQLKVTDVDKAVRGSIVDRNDDKLAFTIEARALTFQPVKIRKQLADASATTPKAPDPSARLRDIAAEVAMRLNNKPDAKTVLKKLKSNESFVYLARAVDPAVAEAISKKFPEVGSERQDLRQYPGGSLAANIVGGIDWDGHGLLGLEDSMDATLAGNDGSVTYDRGSDGVVIPGSYRNRHTAVNGSTIQLTLDDDIQFYVQQQVQQARNASGAENLSAVVLDAKTGEVLAMSNDDTFDPSQDIGRQDDRELGNLAVSSPFEPGSVNKIVTAASVIEFGLSNPDEVLQVPGSIDMGGVTVGDAWEHGVTAYTTTGVFGKSSNVGTLMLAQRVGPERYAEMLDKFGLGQRSGVGLPGESAGLVPPIDQWSGSSFLQPAYRTGAFDDAAADDGHVPGDRQRRGAHPAARRQGHHRPRRQPHRGAASPTECGWSPRRPPRPCATCCARSCNATRWAPSRAPGRWPRSRAIRSRARRAPRRRSTRPAAATTATSTGSPSRAWSPPTTRAT